MALLSGFDQLNAANSTFSDWLNKTNELILLVRGDTISGQTSIVTANSQPGGSLTYGNATIFGQFTSNAMVVINDGGDSANTLDGLAFGGLRGGAWDGAANDVISDTLYIVSNTNFTSETGQVNIHSTYGLYVENNIDVEGDVFFVGNSGSNTDPQMHWESDNNILNFNDNVQATFGTGDDLKVYYTGSRGNVNTDILDVRGSTNTNIFADVLEVKASNGEFYMTANINNGVELYWDNTKKVSTNTYGVEVYGQVLADNGFVTYNNQKLEMGGANYAATHNLELWTDGADSWLTETGSGNLYVQANNLILEATDGTNYFVATAAANTTIHYGDGTKIIEVTAAGIDVEGEANTDTLRVQGDAQFEDGSGNDKINWESTNGILNFEDDIEATFGTNDDFRIYHDSANNTSYIKESGAGDLVLQANNVQIENTDGGSFFCGIAGQGASLHYNSAQKLITTNIGVDITGEANTDTLRVQSTTLLEDDVFFDGTIADQMHWDASLDTLHLKDDVDLYLGTGKDFHIYHDSSSNISYIKESGAGDFILQANNIQLENTDGESYFCGIAGQGASLHYNSVQKLITRADGIEANGIVDTDTLLVSSTANFEGDVYIDGSAANNELHWHASMDTLHLKDNVTLSLGDHNTFEMYHEGANTYIKENGSGDLVLQANNIQIEDTAGQAYFCGIAGAGGSIHYNGAQKLITTNIGVDVTGLVLGDSLQIDGNVDLGASSSDTISVLAEFDTNLISSNQANVGSSVAPWDWGYFNDINVANTATILNLEVTSLEANGVALTGTGGDVTTTSATEIDAIDLTSLNKTQGFKYFVHGKDLSDADSGYAVEINVIITDNDDIYYTRYGEVESNMSDVALVPALAANTTHVILNATCGSASGSSIHRFNVMKIETRDN